MTNKQLTIGLVGAIVIAIIGFYTPVTEKLLGGVTNLDALTLDNGSLTITNGNIAMTSGGITLTSGDVTITGTGKSLILPGGVNVYATSSTFTSATTTPCSLQNPVGATSTVIAYMAQITTGTSTAATVDIGVSPNRFSTTTGIFVQSDAVASGAQDTFVIPENTSTSTIIGPTSWINVKTNEAGVGGYTYVGTCSAIFVAP